MVYFHCTGKSMLETLIFASTNPQYDNRLFIELPVQYMKIPAQNSKFGTLSEHVFYTNWFFFTFRTICVHNKFWQCSDSELGIFMYWSGNLMDNLLSYCGLVDARKSTSEKGLPVYS